MKPTTNLSDEAVFKRFEDFCDDVNSKLSAACKHAIKHDPVKIKTLAPDAQEYSDPVAFALDWQCYAFLKKFKGLRGTDIQSRKKAALSSWSAAEHQCYKTNLRLDSIQRGDCSLLDIPLTGGLEKTPATMATIISMAQRKIESVLGPFSFSNAVKECCWSSGATADLPRGTQLSKKMTEEITVTARALPHFKRVTSRDPAWLSSVLGRQVYNYASLLDSNFNVIRASRHLTVPKNAFTERCIEAGPTANGFLQQGVGRYIRGRLKRVGVDLDDQSFNQWLAGKAYTLGYSTLDLQSASDSVSYQLVKLLLPQRWFSYLDDLRVPFTRVNGKVIRLEKFSAMGNAFTFELESLIFWALAQSVNEYYHEVGGIVAVYGDDIVCKRALYDPLVKVLNFMGFTVNSEKSFKDGNFFESCGANYFMGVDVTGFQQEESLTSLEEIISFHNRALRWSIRIFGTPFSPVSKRLVSGLSDGVHKIPFSSESDGGFLSPVRELGEHCPNHGYKCRVRLFVPDREIQYKQAAYYAYKLRRKQFQNARPDGQPYVTADIRRGTWISTFSWIHRYGN